MKTVMCHFMHTHGTRDQRSVMNIIYTGMCVYMLYLQCRRNDINQNARVYNLTLYNALVVKAVRFIDIL